MKAAGYKGLLIVIDEAETILRMRSDSRHKSLNGIRQIADAAGSYPGMLWVFTGTPEFFDTRHGVAGLAPLHDRIRFLKQGRFASLRQAQLELVPFDAERLRSVALRLRELYPDARTAAASTSGSARPSSSGSSRRSRRASRATSAWCRASSSASSSRRSTSSRSTRTTSPCPSTASQAADLSAEEQHVLSGTALTSPDLPDDDAGTLVPAEDVW